MRLCLRRKTRWRAQPCQRGSCTWRSPAPPTPWKLPRSTTSSTRKLAPTTAAAAAWCPLRTGAPAAKRALSTVTGAQSSPQYQHMYPTCVMPLQYKAGVLACKARWGSCGALQGECVAQVWAHQDDWRHCAERGHRLGACRQLLLAPQGAPCQHLGRHGLGPACLSIIETKRVPVKPPVQQFGVALGHRWSPLLCIETQSGIVHSCRLPAKRLRASSCTARPSLRRPMSS